MEPDDALPIITDGNPHPADSLVVRRIEGAPVITAASAGSASFEFGEGPGPWTMPATTWKSLRTAGDVARSFTAEEI